LLRESASSRILRVECKRRRPSIDGERSTHRIHTFASTTANA